MSQSQPENTCIQTETHGRVGLIRLDRPKQLNALNDALMDQLGDALLMFDGIGGFGMAAAWCGIETVVSCEIGAFGSDVLASLFPAAYHHKDIRTLTKTIIDERLFPRFGADYGRRTILTGGFPCQPFSSTGKRRGAADDRYLWPEMLRIIGDVRPRWVIGENVAGILSMVQPAHVATLESEPDLFGAGNELQTKCGQYTVHRICKDFEAIGYTIRPVVIPACAVGAPHRRDRVWFLASDAAADGEHWRAHDNPASAPASNATSKPRGRGAECEQQENGSEEGSQLLGGSRGWVRSPRGCFRDFPNESPVRTDDDGICPESLRRRIRADFADCLSDDEIEEAIHRADKRFNEEALRAAGNAIVPQVAYEIIRGIVEIERGEHFPDVRKEADKV
mgnify:CR=1 FL=1